MSTVKIKSYAVNAWHRAMDVTDSMGRVIHSKRYSLDGETCIETWREYDSKGNNIHIFDSDGFEMRYDYNSDGNWIHSSITGGLECWYEYLDGKLSHMVNLFPRLYWYSKKRKSETWYDPDGEEISKQLFDTIHPINKYRAKWIF